MFKDKVSFFNFLNDFMNKGNLKIIFVSFIILGLSLVGISLLTLFRVSVVDCLGFNEAEDAGINDSEGSSYLRKVKVDISGEVLNPGIYEVEYGVRVAELIELAGGFSEKADIQYIYQNLNLAKRVIDAEKVYIFSKEEQSKQSNSQSLALDGVKANNNKISVNHATVDELLGLDGIGEKRASQIIENRPFQSLDELVIKEIISQNQFDKIAMDIEI
jgi:competence protein ComEA